MDEKCRIRGRKKTSVEGFAAGSENAQLFEQVDAVAVALLIHAHIRQLFPEGVPVVMAIRDADHRLYLDLRAVARREGKKLADYLRENGLMSPKNPR